MSTKQHLTTRRGFIVGMGFGGVSLYGLWAAYGATPGPLALLGLGNAHTEDGGHDTDAGGHGTAADHSGGDEFRRNAAEFVDRYILPDGIVHPRRLDRPPTPVAVHAGAMAEHGHSPSSAGAGHDSTDGAGDAGPIDVYLLAEKWAYQPAHLRLDAGARYRFRMMAADIPHGASIQLGRGSRMIRLRPNAVVEMAATFARPGNYLVYCTVYCGQGHDLMQARIEVV